METTQQAPSARDALVKGLSEARDFSQFKDNSEPEVDASPSSESTLNNSDHSEDRSVSEGAEETQASSQPETNEKQEGATKQEEVAANRTDTQTNQPKKQTKAPPRIQELLDQGKQKDTTIADLQRQLAELQVKVNNPEQPKSQVQPDPKPLIPKPEFETDYLQERLAEFQAEEVEALVNKDKDQILNARKKIAKVQDLIKQNETYEQRLNQAKTEHQRAVAHYNQQALEKYPALKDQNSEHYKEYTGLRSWIDKNLHTERIPIMDHPRIEAIAAQLAEWKLASSRLAAADSEIKKLREENQKLIKAGQPLTTTGKVDVGSKESSVNDAKSNLLNGLRTFNRERSYVG